MRKYLCSAVKEPAVEEHAVFGGWLDVNARFHLKSFVWKGFTDEEQDLSFAEVGAVAGKVYRITVVEKPWKPDYLGKWEIIPRESTEEPKQGADGSKRSAEEPPPGGGSSTKRSKPSEDGEAEARLAKEGEAQRDGVGGVENDQMSQKGQGGNRTPQEGGSKQTPKEGQGSTSKEKPPKEPGGKQTPQEGQGQCGGNEKTPKEGQGGKTPEEGQDRYDQATRRALIPPDQAAKSARLPGWGTRATTAEERDEGLAAQRQAPEETAKEVQGGGIGKIPLQEQTRRKESLGLGELSEERGEKQDKADEESSSCADGGRFRIQETGGTGGQDTGRVQRQDTSEIRPLTIIGEYGLKHSLGVKPATTVQTCVDAFIGRYRRHGNVECNPAAYSLSVDEQPVYLKTRIWNYCEDGEAILHLNIRQTGG
ncbi:hypothetical protein KFL_005560070 [Klebsormidium nitens]|uniref:Uncharacterized protein n=1 Tax=Klebsormidium nitens TaxID=105231 RepID=A0A1Y1INP3_KLENI|nr:hypothetical protein KFL_005560070 [Klebsormidium nitens]|eukprot:GAQ89728.1 hypothetical protein KFL_005560070 [Klebsormidium nitens]